MFSLPKQTVALLVVLVALVLPAVARGEPTGAPMAVHRWWHAGDKDWISIATGSIDPNTQYMQGAGYTQPSQAQFYVAMIGTDSTAQVAVNRWWHPADRDWVTIPQDSITDDTLTSWGYVNKTFQFYAWTSAPSGSGRVPVYRWWHAGDRDWITLRDGEIADAQMMTAGYSNKTFLFYAYPAPNGAAYFSLGQPTTVLTQTLPWEQSEPHTFSVVEANTGGFRYWGYFGPHLTGSFGLARSNDLVTWTKDPNPVVTGGDLRWPSVVLSGGIYNMVHDVGGFTTGVVKIVARTSTDGRNFSAPTTIVDTEPNAGNWNATLFKHPADGTFYLYWLRHLDTGSHEIMVRSASTLNGLASASQTRIAFVPPGGVVAAPQVILRNNTYYLATETKESSGTGQYLEWRTRILTSSSPVGLFSEVITNPVLFGGSACFFQHIFGGKLHGFYCKTDNDAAGGEHNWRVEKRSEP